MALSAEVCLQLDTWGAWERVEQLCRETLGWLPERSEKAATFLHLLGIVAQQRGDYDAALDGYRKSLAIEEELGNRAGMASSMSQIGILLTSRGDPAAGVAWNLQSLALRRALRVPQVRINLTWLRRQRALLGAARFAAVLAEHLDPPSQQAVEKMLEQAEESASPPPDAQGPR